MTRRNIELVLLCVGAPIVILLFAQLALTEGAQLGLNSLGVPISIFVAFICAHLVVRKFAPGADPALLPISFVLSGIGIAFVTRIAPYTDVDTSMAVNQVIWLFLGIACLILVLIFSRNLDKIAHYKYTWMIIGFILLLSPLIPGIGAEINGSQIWIVIGGLSFQPGELAKIAIILFLAGYMAQNRETLSVFTWRLGPIRLPDLRTLLPLLIMWGIAIVIVVFETDLGSALVLFFIFLTMLYVASGKKFYIVIALGLTVLAGLFLYYNFSHVAVRVTTWLNPFADAQNTGYQLVQALYSMADGGLFGVGIGNGLGGGGNGISRIPVCESDFIFAVIAEEIGLLGAAGVLLLFLCYAIRGFVTAARAKSDVSSFIAVGLTASCVLQAFIIVGGVTRLIPLTGLTLPFISQGGSSLVVSCISLGLLLRCGEEGTGIDAEVTNAGGTLSANSVLGRISLGKRLTGTMVVFSLLFAALVANLTNIMVVHAEEYQNLSSNNHTMAKEADSPRGTISTADGVVLAESVEDESGNYIRKYPAGDLASHVVGYYSQIYGTAGIEATYNNILIGQESYATWTDVINSLAGKSVAGNDLTLTLNSTIQRAAQEAINSTLGAVAVINPETGAVLALASSPTYVIADVEEILANASSSDPATSSLYNRATSALYAPGSTFKIVTLATAFENNIANETTTYASPGILDIGNADITNFGKASYGTITLSRATEVSSNTVFGQLGVEIGPEILVSGADAFEFDKNITFDIPLAESVMPDPREMTEWETAWAAAGMPVGEHTSAAGPQSTVLEMALCGCGIANEGAIMQPYLVESVYNANGERSYAATPTILNQAVSAETANRVKEVLVGVVENGTGTRASIDGVQVAGKTGTAEKETSDNTWFVGMAPAEDPKIVISIIVEDSESGYAAEKAQNVLKTALEVEGLL